MLRAAGAIQRMEETGFQGLARRHLSSRMPAKARPASPASHLPLPPPRQALACATRLPSPHLISPTLTPPHHRLHSIPLLLIFSRALLASLQRVQGNYARLVPLLSLVGHLWRAVFPPCLACGRTPSEGITAGNRDCGQLKERAFRAPPQNVVGVRAASPPLFGESFPSSKFSLRSLTEAPAAFKWSMIDGQRWCQLLVLIPPSPKSSLLAFTVPFLSSMFFFPLGKLSELRSV